MTTNRFDCGGYYKKYDMTGEIRIGTGIVKVHDIFDPLPDFMKQADVILTDPPYNQSALSSFYTKAGVKDKKRFSDFLGRFFQIVDEINPKIIVLEIGTSQESIYKKYLSEKYKNIAVSEAFYYNRENCLFIAASNEELPLLLNKLPDIDEEKIINLICKELEYDCICDPVIGTGLVGWYANKYGKRFVGTELSEKRLGLLIESITTGKKVM